LLLYQEILKNRKKRANLNGNFLVFEIISELKKQHYKINTHLNEAIPLSKK